MFNKNVKSQVAGVKSEPLLDLLRKIDSNLYTEVILNIFAKSRLECVRSIVYKFEEENYNLIIK